MNNSYDHLRVRKMLTRVSLVLFMLLFVFVMVSGYPNIAGSCDSPRSGHHGDGRGVGGGYNLEVKDSQEIYSPGQVFLYFDQ